MATITSLSFRMNSFYNGEGMRQARRDIARLDSSMNALSKASKALVPGMRDMAAAALALGPALIPIVGGLLAIGASAGSAMAGAGAAVGVFVMAMQGAIEATVGADSAFGVTSKAVTSAEKALAKTTKGTKEYDAALKKVTQAEKAHEAAIRALPPVQEKFARAYDSIGKVWAKFIKDTASFTLGPATTMLEAAAAAVPKLTSVVKAVAPEMQRAADATKAWVTNGGLDRFLTFVKTSGVPALRGFIDAARSLFGALGIGMRETAPLGAGFVKWLTETMAAFKSWAAGGGFERFLTWLQANKGSLIQAAKDLGTFFKNIGTAVAGMSGAAFVVLGTFFKVLASFPPGLLQAMMYAFIGITMALKIYAVVAFVAAAATTVMTLAAAPFGALMIGAAITIGAVIAAIIALAVGIYFLVKHWDTVWAAVKATAQTVWGWLLTAWNATWGAIKTAAMAVWNFLTNGWGQFLLIFLGGLGLLIYMWKHWDAIWGWVKMAATVVWDALKIAWGAFVGGLLTAWNAVSAPIMESWNRVWPEISEAAINVWNRLKAVWDLLWTGIKMAWDVFWSVFGPVFRVAWTGIVESAKSAWATLTAAWQLVWTVIQTIFNVGWAVLSGLWQVGWAALTGMARVAWSILTGAWSVVWSVIRGAWNVFYAAFSGVFIAAWNVIVAMATGIWNVMKAAWSALWSVVTAIFTTFLAIFTGNWGRAWTAIKDAAAAIWNVIRTLWQGLLNVLRTAFEGFVNIIRAAWSAFWTAIQSTAVTFWNALRNTFQTFLTSVQNLWNTVWNAVRTAFQAVVNGIMAIAQAWWAAMRAAFNAGLTFISALWNTIWTNIRTFFNTAVNALQTAANTLWTALRTIFTAGSTWLRTTFWNPVRDLFTKTIPSAFDAGVKAVGTAWDKLRNIVRKPVQAIVDVVYNGGIVKLWNVVAGVFGADKLTAFKMPSFKDGGPTGNGSSDGFLAKVHPGEHVWTKQEVAGAGGHEAVAKLRQRAMGGAKVRTYGEHSFADGGGILGTGVGMDFGPDLIPDGFIKNAFSKLKDLALGSISGPFNKAVDGVAKMGKSAVKAAIPGSGSGMEKLGTGMIDKISKTIKDWVKERDVAPVELGGGNGFIPWKPWQAGDGTRQNYGGVQVNRRTAAMLNNAVKIAKTGFSMFQGSYSNAVSASGGTHSGGGAVDLGPAKDSIVGAMRASGFAAWRRTPAEGFSPHIHGIAAGDPTVSPAAAAQVKALMAGRNGLAGNGKDTYSSPGGGGTSASAAKATARGMLGNYGWASHWSALEALWNRESGWRWNADNPTSDAYGIPQALPGSKMKSAGADWKTNPATQIKWGLGYIKSRYGTPSKADAFQRRNNWYADGTRSAAPGWGVVGERGAELMRMRGGEQIMPLKDLAGSGSSGDVHLTVTIDARGADVAAVKRLENVLPDKLRMALEQGVGSRP